MLPHRMRLAWLGISCVLAACSDSQAPLPPPPQAKELVVLTRPGPTTYFVGADGHVSGFEYDLAQLFGRYLGLPVRFVLADTLESLQRSLSRGRAHFAAAGLYRETAAPDGFIFGPPYHEAQPVLVYNTAEPAPRDWRDVGNKPVAVLQGGTADMKWLQSARQTYPELTWQPVPTANPDLLLEKVAQGEAPYAVADSNALARVRNLYLDIDDAFEVAPKQQLAWLFPAGAPELQQQAQAFFARAQQDGTLHRLLDRYYGHLDRIEPVDAGIFQEQARSVLPSLRKYFQQAQEATGIEWRLLAAIAYAESQWDPLATSPTNVRGIMMLTEETAQRMRVTDRLDAHQSVLAGARYVQEIKRMLPARIAEPDRTWIALAAYNIGIAHLEDCRVLAQKRHLNPDSWPDLKKIFPLLAKPQYANTLKHGPARGGASVVFVETIRAYYDLLLRLEPAYTPRLHVVRDAGAPAMPTSLTTDAVSVR